MNPQQQFGPIVDTRFPGLTRDQVSRLEQVTSNFTGLQKLQKQQELYQQTIKQIQANKNQEDRVAAENEKYCRSLSKDEKSMTTDQCSVRLEQLADTVKNYYGLNPNVDTNTIVNGLVKLNKQKNVDNELLNKYLDSGDKEYLYQMGFEQRPTEDENQYSWFATHPKEVQEFGVGVAQSPGKWGYNLMGQWMDKLGKSMADKLEGTELADWVKQTAIDMFGEDEVRAFAEQKQQELKNGNAFDGRTQTDIRTPILGEDRADTTATKIGETVGDIGTAIALSYPMASALAPYMGLNTASQAGRTLLLGSTQGAADMVTYELGANNEMASPKEMAVGGVIGALSPFIVPMVGSISKGVSSKYGEIMNTIRTANKGKLRSELVDLFSRGVKPSSAGIKSTAAQEKIYDDAMDAVETIIGNKNNLRYVTQDGEEIYGKLPTNNREFAQALEQSKRDVYNQYNAITNGAGEKIEISTDGLIDELLKLKNDKAAMLGNQGLENAIDSWLNGLKDVKSLTPAQVQRKMQEINKKLEAFYKNPNPNDVSGNSVDALVKNWLSKEMDDAIESALGSSAQYEELKRAYASLKTIEKDVNHRAIVSGRQSPNSLVDSIADISSAENIIDMLTNPTAGLKVLGKQALKKYIKSANSSDNMVKKLFEKAEKELERSGTLKTRQQILKQQQQEYERWLNQGADKNYLPFIEGADDAGKTVIPGGERIAVTPEGYAVREGKIGELPTENINYVDNVAGQTKGINEGISKTTISEDVSDLLPLNERVGGDDLLNAEDLINDVKSVGAKVDDNGYVTVYHQTTPEAAEQIRKTGKMSGKENGIFFSTSKDATQAEGRGAVKLEFKIPAEKLQLDDIFTNNADVKILSKPGEEIDIGKYLVKDTGENSLKSNQLEKIQKSNILNKEDYKEIKKYKDNLKELYDKAGDDDYVYFVHNTKSENVDAIKNEGLRSYKSRGIDAHGEDSPAAIWGTLTKDHTGFGGNQIYFRIPKSEAKKLMVNDSEIMVYRDIKPDDIVAINRSSGEKAESLLGKTNRADLIDFFDEGVKEFGYDKVKKRMVEDYGLGEEWEMYEKSVGRK